MINNKPSEVDLSLYFFFNHIFSNKYKYILFLFFSFIFFFLTNFFTNEKINRAVLMWNIDLQANKYTFTNFNTNILYENTMAKKHLVKIMDLDEVEINSLGRMYLKGVTSIFSADYFKKNNEQDNENINSISVDQILHTLKNKINDNFLLKNYNEYRKKNNYSNTFNESPYVNVLLTGSEKNSQQYNYGLILRDVNLDDPKKFMEFMNEKIKSLGNELTREYVTSVVKTLLYEKDNTIKSLIDLNNDLKKFYKLAINEKIDNYNDQLKIARLKSQWIDNNDNIAAVDMNDNIEAVDGEVSMGRGITLSWAGTGKKNMSKDLYYLNNIVPLEIELERLEKISNSNEGEYEKYITRIYVNNMTIAKLKNLEALLKNYIDQYFGQGNESNWFSSRNSSSNYNVSYSLKYNYSIYIILFFLSNILFLIIMFMRDFYSSQKKIVDENLND